MVLYIITCKHTRGGVCMSSEKSNWRVWDRIQMQDWDPTIGSDNESCNKERFSMLWTMVVDSSLNWSISICHAQTLKLERARGISDTCKFCIHIILCSFDEHRSVHWSPTFTQSNKKCIYRVPNMESILKQTLSIHCWFYSMQRKLLNRSLVSFEWSRRRIVWWYDLSNSEFSLHTQRRARC